MNPRDTFRAIRRAYRASLRVKRHEFLRDIRTPASWADYALAVALGAALAVLLAYGI